MMATSIFGLSTLLSSHQIYNVQNRLQEDHLQHLALFTEYGRATLKLQVKDESSAKDERAKKSTSKENPDAGANDARRTRQLIANNHFKLCSFL